MGFRVPLVLLAALAAVWLPEAGRAAVAFAPAVNYPLNMGMFNAVSVATADFNNDGLLDLAFAGQASGTVEVRLNAGGGTYPTFSFMNTLMGGQAFDVGAADMNGDGRRDLVVGLTQGGQLQAWVFFGLGNGSFMGSSQAIVTAGTAGLDIAVGDVNGDGRPDVLATTPASANMFVLFNNGMGGLFPQTPVPLAAAANDVAIGSLNGDAWPDAVVVGSFGMRAVLGTGGGAFAPAATYMAGPTPTSVALADLDNDGSREAVVGNFVSGGVFQVTTLRGFGNGTFGMPSATPAGPGMFGGAEVAVGAIDGDAFADVAVVNTSLNELRVLTGTGNTTLQAAQGFSTSASQPSSVALGDLDGDGKLDAAVANQQSDTVTIFLQAQPPSAPLNLTVTRGYQSLFLNWSPPASGNATGYRIYRGTTSGGETFLTTVGNQTSFTDTGLADGATFYYKVSATNVAGESPRSNEAFGTTFTVPSAPADVSATPGTGLGEVVVSWQPPASDGGAPVGFYVLCRLATPSGPRYCLNVGNVTSFSDDGNEPLQTFYYEVAAVNVVGQGPWSAQACSKPFPWLALLGC